MTPREGHQQKVNGSSHSHTLPRPSPPCRSLPHLDFLQRFIRRLKRALHLPASLSLSVALKANREEMGRGNTCFLKSNNCKVKCLRTRGGGGKWDKEGSREKCHRHGEKFCGRSSICPRLLKRRSQGGKEGSGTEPEREEEV